MTGGSPGEASDAQRLLLACHLVFKNALELGAEAELLLEHSHFARAYFLSHIASEELGKVPYLLAAAEGAERGVGVDWRALRLQLEDHREKLRALAYLDHVAVPNEQQL